MAQMRDRVPSTTLGLLGERPSPGACHAPDHGSESRTARYDAVGELASRQAFTLEIEGSYPSSVIRRRRLAAQVPWLSSR